MAIFNFFGSKYWNSYDDLGGGSIIAHSGRSLTYVSDTGFRVLLRGTGFTYDDQGIPTGGTLLEMTVKKGGHLLANYQELNFALTDYITLALGHTSGSPDTTPDLETLYADLRHGSDLIRSDDAGRKIVAYDGDDTIYGNGGDDWMSGGRGVDSYFGGNGQNGVLFGEGPDPKHGARVNFSLKTGNILDDGYGNTETAVGVTGADGTKFGDRFTGSVGDNAFYGNSGNDTLIGGRGDDRLSGGDQKDTFYGGDGIDTLWFEDVTDGRAQVRVDLSKPFASRILDDGYGNTEYASGIENIVGGAAGDDLTGNEAVNTFWGNAGRDSLKTMAGNDSLFGGADNDTLFGGDGDDYFEGGAGSDVIYGGLGVDRAGFWSDSDSAHGVTLNLYLASGQVTNDGTGGTDTVDGIEEFEGTDFADDFIAGYQGVVFLGFGGDDTLNGGHSDDTLYGGDGDDQLSGLFGTNTFLGGKGVDSFFGQSSASLDILAFWDVEDGGHGATVDLRRATGQVIDDGFGNTETATDMEYLDGTDFSDSFTGDSEDNVMWGNAGADTLIGDLGDDNLYGGLGTDSLSGGDGSDVLVGAEGKDTLTGGADADYFYFMGPSPGSDGVDTITDFTKGSDGIVLSVGWSETLALDRITSAQFRSGAGAINATTSAQRVIYDTSTGNLYFDHDGLGGDASVLIATLSNHALLTFDRVFTVDPF